MSDIVIVILAGLVAAGLLVLVLRTQGPDPRLAAQSLPEVARPVIGWFVLAAVLTLVLRAVPDAFRLPAIGLFAVVSGGVGALWVRRHPRYRVEPGASTLPAAPAEVIASTGEWIRALVVVAGIGIGGTLLVVLAISRLFCGCTTVGPGS